MKLGTLDDGTRDGQLIVVSRDLQLAHLAGDIAPRLQSVLDDWQFLAPQLADLYDALNQGKAAQAFRFDPHQCLAPLPRAYQWADGSAYVNHVELLRRSRQAEMPERFWQEPLMYQGGSDDFIGPCRPALFASEQWGIDFEAEVAIIVDDVPMQCSQSEASGHIRLLMLANDWSLRHLVPDELAKGFGFYQSKPATAFAPLAVTPDELGAAWDGERMHLPVRSYRNETLVGQPQAGEDMVFGFPQLIEHAAKTRRLRAGSIIGSGTVSNRDRSRGYSCIAEIRALEIMDQGLPNTAYLHFGERIRIEVLDARSENVFGTLDQQVLQNHP
ncbi:MAG: FAA hydrolase family protein [Betaproteobacteria bacterium]|nr:fumarylacetoacetate hydrolase family protein [Pseudomonadota bacterium]NBO11265.1 FAA hydrolase family protein [Betaproteobacteria bacterium]NBO44601.1 FAA hydrolase family protein [Betaproteobacteria bacterium]NBP11022.1 FAA hydrolase family protein [Betaproteobacteria bacterium]NBP62445.1 FAA hydrolase family protein [Betaproteobacteria bacterium]